MAGKLAEKPGSLWEEIEPWQMLERGRSREAFVSEANNRTFHKHSDSPWSSSESAREGRGRRTHCFFSSLFDIACADPSVTSRGLCGLRKGAEEVILAVPRLPNAIPTFRQTHSLEDFSYSFLYLIVAFAAPTHFLNEMRSDVLLVSEAL